MKTLKYIAFALCLTLFTNCGDDDAPVVVTQLDSKTYNISPVGDSGISGTATFSKNSDFTMTVQFDLNGTDPDVSLPAHLHLNTAAETGGVEISFASINGETGQSTTNFSFTDTGVFIVFEDLLEYDAHIAIHESETNNPIVAISDIGVNELTNNFVVYPLNEADVSDLSGEIKFTERINGEALAEINLTGTPAGGNHPTHIHQGSVATAPGAIVFTFNNVDGTSGYSATNVSQLDNGTNFGYNQVLTIDGYINVHLSPNNLMLLLAQGDIGANF